MFNLYGAHCRKEKRITNEIVDDAVRLCIEQGEVLKKDFKKEALSRESFFNERRKYCLRKKRK